MLGLGDIVIPGIFIALLLRFDVKRSVEDSKLPLPPGKHEPASYTKTYFNATLIGYILGLIATVLVMYAFKAAQPALLYLVPTCLGSSLLTAVSRGELKRLLDYNEESEEKSDNEAKKEK